MPRVSKDTYKKMIRLIAEMVEREQIKSKDKKKVDSKKSARRYKNRRYDSSDNDVSDTETTSTYSRDSIKTPPTEDCETAEENESSLGEITPTQKASRSKWATVDETVKNVRWGPMPESWDSSRLQDDNETNVKTDDDRLREGCDLVTKISTDMKKLIQILERAQVPPEHSPWGKSRLDRELDDALYLLCSDYIVKAKTQLKTISDDFQKVRYFTEEAKICKDEVTQTKPHDYDIDSKGVKDAVAFFKGIEAASGIPLEKVVQYVNKGLFRDGSGEGRDSPDTFWYHGYTS